MDYDLVFYSIDFNEIRTNFVMDEEKLYNENVKGIPAFLIFQNLSNGRYDHFTYFQPQQLKNKERYALLYYDRAGTFNTRSVTLVSHLELSKIVIKKHRIKK